MPVDHLDEGTIHAWLDGALSDAEAAEVEVHVATCATCQTAVAEARGLIAMGSVILAKLDDVPAQVIPPRTTARPRRSIRVWPLQALAAGVIVAIGIAVFHRTSAVDVPPMSAPKMSTVPSGAIAPTPAPHARTMMSPVAVPRSVVPASPVPMVGGGSPAHVAPATFSSPAADAATPAMAKTEAAVGPQRRMIPSPQAVRAATASASMLAPRLPSHCDSLRKTVAHADSLLPAGGRDTTVSPAQRDSAKSCQP